MIPPGFTIESTTDRITPMATLQLEEDDALTRKKLLESTSFSAMSGLPQDPTVLQGENKYAAFRGLYVVQSCTASRHVKYAMEVASPELQLHTRITRRFSAFYVMRKRLLKSLKKCRDPAARPTLLSNDSLFPEWDLSLWGRSCCPGCQHVRKTLKKTPFPRRAIFTTSVDDVDARSPLLENFLSTCIRLVSDWPGCARGRKFACVVLGQFLGTNLLFLVFQQLRLTMAELAASNEMEIVVPEVVEVDEKQKENVVVVSPQISAL
jgi:hypothetical protein